ncbi:cytochrome-c peroxidase [Schlesneria paludicola]|uniref:cytochrome-c peroxidase n=1 Tax=Schlesneria paludicola TaxID=360056 RepID=UPI000299DC26|nr:cytochrome c peroxidase [Schlesneria paludicola]
MNTPLVRRLSLMVVLAAGSVGAAETQSILVVVHPKENPSTAEKIALGQQLYFDGRLSADNKVSCATCHDPAKGFSNGEQFATGVEGKKGGRNSPTVINSAFQNFQFWDGRARTLEEQALGPIQNPIEMNMKMDDVVAKLNQIEGYRKQFQQIFGTDVTADGIAKAIAAYERTIVSRDAPYDRFKAGDTAAMSESAQRGMKLFFGKANCSACHAGPNFTDNGFHNIGLPSDDEGRHVISKTLGDKGAFKTPTLREVAKSAPYMHDGSLKTLEEVVAHYIKGGSPHPQLDEALYPLKLSTEEITDLVTFMKEGLSSPSYPAHTVPELPQ